jgi:hypothetical protein
MKRTTSLLILGALCLGLGFQFLNAWVAIAFSIVLAALAWKDAQ